MIRSLAFALGWLGAGLAHASPRDFVVYAPGMGGSPAQARPYLDTFLRDLEPRLGWATGSAAADYFEDVKEALAFVRSKNPGFGLVTPGLYLDLACHKEPVDVVATVVGIGETGGLNRFHVVVKDTAIAGLGDLAGKRLASNHLDNPKFVTRVVFHGQLDVEKSLKAQSTSSPIKPLRQLDRGEADAALIDDAQLSHMKTLPLSSSLKVIFSSEPLPPFPVVAFGKVVKPDERDQMRKVLLGLCSSKTGAAVCQALLVTRFEAVDAGAFRTALLQYCK